MKSLFATLLILGSSLPVLYSTEASAGVRDRVEKRHDRRVDRRDKRHDRREDRRDKRQDRREDRRERRQDRRG